MKIQIAFILLIMTSFVSKAQTINNETALGARISKVNEVSFDELETLFSKFPVYKLNCYPATSKNVPLEGVEVGVLGPILTQTLPSEVNFEFHPLKEGFNIGFVIEDRMTNLDCNSGDSPGTCKNLTTTHEDKFESPLGDENFSPEGERSETWTFYVQSPETIYAERVLDAQIKQKNWAGRAITTISASRHDICRLELKSFTLDL